jgi:hypothetical protein
MCISAFSRLLPLSPPSFLPTLHSYFYQLSFSRPSFTGRRLQQHRKSREGAEKKKVIEWTPQTWTLTLHTAIFRPEEPGLLERLQMPDAKREISYLYLPTVKSVILGEWTDVSLLFPDFSCIFYLSILYLSLNWCVTMTQTLDVFFLVQNVHCLGTVPT